MAFKFELEQWQKACDAFDSNNYDEALKTFISIADNAKMHFNIGSIFTVVNDHKRAITAFNRAIAKDPYFAVAYFQRGVSLFLLGNLEAAKFDFDSAYQRLRGNTLINYQQLGLPFRLYACEVLFNRGICQLYLNKIDAGLTDLYHAQKSKETEEHDIIDQAARARGKGYSVYSVPPGLLFRPSDIRLRQLKGIDMFHDKLSYPYTVSKRKNSIFVYNMHSVPPSTEISQPPTTPTTTTTITDMLHNVDTRRSPVTSFSSASSSSSINTFLHSPVSPILQREDSINRNSSNSTASASSHTSTNKKDFITKTNTNQKKNDLTITTRHTFLNDLNNNNNTSHEPIPTLTPTTPTIVNSGNSNRPVDDIVTTPGTAASSVHSSSATQFSTTNLAAVSPSSSQTSLVSNNLINGKLKIKCHFTDTRIILSSLDIRYEELVSKVAEKFQIDPKSIQLAYKDDEEEKVLMIDDDDLDMARQINRARQQQSFSAVEKLEIWIL
ncbi:hypothetical protein BDF20DRAFT_850031 [Mycotypha africana]|uniref:uncharacterized protein n=1 Tax=Mycotypha africana TaxID=64632 RepID=UPI0023011A76|nr:uncharacterized protein BDF20DRAFT_850031 [Mycotypha africana]KAI8987403.1 hypothetical protein BDF20DRAFT_850031 [Mycotypha africana]